MIWTNKTITVTFTLCFLLLMFSCTKSIERQPKIRIDDLQNVLIIGNSITLHEAKPSIGWDGNWGMAASCQDSDYVHLVIDYINNRSTNCIITYVNIADFEIDFNDYDLNILDSLRQKKAELIICRLGENVNDDKAKKYNFSKYLNDLLSYLKTDNTAVICTDSFWPKTFVNKQIESVCIDSGYLFMPIQKFYNDSTNMAFSSFKNVGVARHPSDKGMRQISEKIIEAIIETSY